MSQLKNELRPGFDLKGANTKKGEECCRVACENIKKRKRHKIKQEGREGGKKRGKKDLGCARARFSRGIIFQKKRRESSAASDISD